MAAAVLGLCLTLLLTAGGVVLGLVRPQDAVIGLASGTVARAPDGAVVEVPTGDPALIPGTRVLDGPGAADAMARERAWLAAGSVPAVPELGIDSDLVRGALLDLHVLTQAYGVPVAGWTGPWRYVWPRDAAFAAAAFARTGHRDDADRVIDFLGAVQPTSGVFQARYRPDGSGPPDARGTQLDGTGWALWATAQVADALPRAEQAVFVDRHRTLIDASTRAALAAIDTRSGLPPASPDYWEVREGRPTLATAAVLAAGLQAATRLETMVGDRAAAERATAGAGRLRSAIDERFGADGFPRRLGGPASSVDLGVAFLLPPFADGVDSRASARFASAGPLLVRPAGGLAPGGSWRRDGVSWTPTTATWAMVTAGCGDRTGAVALLRWLEDHRTAEGSLPEKVLADGQPAAVAPLAWTAAAVVLTATELQTDPQVGPRTSSQTSDVVRASGS